MTTAVRLKPEIEHRLKYLVQETHRSKSFYIEQALEAYLDEREEFLLASSRWEAYKGSGQQGISLTEIEQKMSLDAD